MKESIPISDEQKVAHSLQMFLTVLLAPLPKFTQKNKSEIINFIKQRNLKKKLE